MSELTFFHIKALCLELRRFFFKFFSVFFVLLFEVFDLSLGHSNKLQVFRPFRPLHSSKKKFIKILIWAFEAFWRNPRFWGRKIWITLRPLWSSLIKKKNPKNVDFCQIIVRSIQLLRLRVNRQRRQYSCWDVLNFRSAQSPLRITYIYLYTVYTLYVPIINPNGKKF